MFIRRKKNHSGSTSVIVVDKANRKFRYFYDVTTLYFEALLSFAVSINIRILKPDPSENALIKLKVEG
jgi:hypothetical protein